MAAGSGTYEYDGAGYRVEKTANGVVTLYWPGALNGVLDESDNVGANFGPQVAVAGMRVWSKPISGDGVFLFQDHLGSTRVTGDVSGNTRDDIDYLPFGGVVANYRSGSSNHYLFAGYESDSTESSTDYATARNLNYSMARFNRPDPYDGSYNPTNPQTLNRYSYVVNNPLSYIDPLGLECIIYLNDGTTVDTGDCGGDPGDTDCNSDYVSCVSGGSSGGDDPCDYMNCSNPDGPPIGPSELAPSKGIVTCASEAAAQVSVADGIQALGIGTSGVSGFITNALGGNAISGLTDLIQSFKTGEGGGHSVYYNMAQALVAGPTQGFGSGLSIAGKSVEGTPWGSGPADLATGALVSGGFNTITGAGQSIQTINGAASLASSGLEAAEFATGFGELKLAYDAGSYAMGLFQCATGIIH